MLNSVAPEVKSPEGLHADALLAWYDRHRRRLPWRALPGEKPDPYRVWLSEIMLQQTTVKTVGPYFQAFLTRWPTVDAMAESDEEQQAVQAVKDVVFVLSACRIQSIDGAATAPCKAKLETARRRAVSTLDPRKHGQ